MTGPDERSGSLRAADGVALHYRSWRAPAPHGAVLLAHGLGEHAGRYAEVAGELCAAGLDVFALDHRGHGRSGGRRGHVARFAEYVADFDAFRRSLAGEIPPGRPLFLLGHSLGGLIVLRYLQEHPEVELRGAVLSAPALDLGTAPPRWKHALARLLSRVAPALPLPSEIDPADLTHDTERLRALKDDPLVHTRITPRLYTEMLDAMRRVREAPERIRVPSLLWLIPGADRIVHPGAALAFARTLPPAVEVEVRSYPALYHECLNELERASVVRDLLRWLRARGG